MVVGAMTRGFTTCSGQERVAHVHSRTKTRVLPVFSHIT